MNTTRRAFLSQSGIAGAALAFPAIIPARVLGKEAPSKKIQVGVIGCGRIAKYDLTGISRNQDLAVLYGISDCDLYRMDDFEADAKRFMKAHNLPTIKKHQNYHDLLADPGIDAVMICTPDHTHAELCIESALAGKDVFMQKPMASSLEEGRLIVKVFEKTGRIFHLGSQQRSEGPNSCGPQFRRAVEYVRDGRIGKILRIEVGLPNDPVESKNAPLKQDVPANFDYNTWLGPTPEAQYCELRTHWQGRKGRKVNYGRPGWLTIQAYSLGMITGWGSHHLDIAQWGLGMETSGPVAAEGTAQFPKRRLWDVHGKLDVRLTYANGTVLHVAGTDRYPCGVRFVGEKGWIFCSRGSVKTTSSDPDSGSRSRWSSLDASDKKLITGEVSASVREQVVRNPLEHHRVWLNSIHSRKPTNITPEIAHRSTSACILSHIAYTLKRPLKWDPVRERFLNDDEANRMLSHEERAPFGARNALKRAGWKI